MIKTLKHKDLSNQLTFEICDSAFFQVTNDQINMDLRVRTDLII